MPRSRVQSERVFSQLGKLVVRWNDLELQLRRLLFSLCDDWVTAAIFSVEMNMHAFLNALRIVAKEYDAHVEKLNRLIRQAAGTPHDLVSEHVHCVADCADALRLYRNYYAHGITSPREGEPFTVGGINARGRLTTYDQLLTAAEMRKITVLIGRTVRYAQAVERCIAANEHPSRARPTWPEKLPVPDKLKKPRSNLLDRIPLL